MRDFFSDLEARLFHPVTLFASLVLAVFLAASGPYDTYIGFSFGHRLLFWGSVVVISVFSGLSVWGFVESIVGKNAGYWENTSLIAALNALVLPGIINTLGVAMGMGKPDEMPGKLGLFALVFGITFFVSTLRYFYIGKHHPKKPRLISRLSDPQVREINRVSVRDHYVDVFTDRGKETLLLRFSDALAELDGLKGFRVHRSHWVSADAIDRFHKEKGRMMVLLRDGSKVPVSRGYREEVEAEISQNPAMAKRVQLASR